ncbi:hypothetical protein [Streptomyces sp. NPDC006012]|uniref:hypothetical protein n=1 Tax=Streptomyces sp. NPDC006012 TaxID=3364739 RepID=UPI0036A46090
MENHPTDPRETTTRPINEKIDGADAETAKIIESDSRTEPAQLAVQKRRAANPDNLEDEYRNRHGDWTHDSGRREEGIGTQQEPRAEKPRDRAKEYAQRRKLWAESPEYRRKKLEEQKTRRANNPGGRKEEYRRHKASRADDEEYHERRKKQQKKWLAANPRDHRKERERRQKNRQSFQIDAGQGVQERVGQGSLTEAVAEYSLRPEIAASMIYEEYWVPGLPVLPPTGLKVAVHPESAGQGQDAVVVTVTLRTPHQAGASGSSVPPFLADPSLDLDDPAVKQAILSQGVSEEDFQEAKTFHSVLLDVLADQDPGLPGADSALATSAGFTNLPDSAPSFHSYQDFGYHAQGQAMPPAAQYGHAIPHPAKEQGPPYPISEPPSVNSFVAAYTLWPAGQTLPRTQHPQTTQTPPSTQHTQGSQRRAAR